ncbi:Mrp/NBP35 family ATP-binding protein [Veillonella magna]|uniref:Iron-sulfur cluster carrier protein n=1 Tax=Veillonella magna TaxID=464322 RepID=A0ABS2GD85_9FIRM|nr:Mrp/NBP35 family ATP-binding protein [Veillonella magna]MBD8976897.1 ATP-binding protein [Veillonella magna]MBM6823974.1 Mrp/NBP35 family ATP-binding protein [Veillonella magna]MBM6912114.1 Mrp/NBP35 family ATP-binding protein [Veillonella magna]
MACGSSGGCSGCSSASTCGSAQQQPQDLTAKLNPLSSVKHVIGVVSGKGGVGKSLVTSMLAISMARKGYKVGILDADITGPSIPKVFGVKGKARVDEAGMYPLPSKGGIDIMSVNLLLENETDPVLWRGPIVGNVVKQFYTDVIWQDLDYLFVDMPPGTGDVAITVYQSLQLDGIVVVTSPQDLVAMIVEKAVKMADLMQVPIIGVVENFSYFHCPDNGKDYKIFGDSHIDEVLKRYNLLLMARLPINPDIAALCDAGKLEDIEKTGLEDVVLPQ